MKQSYLRQRFGIVLFSLIVLFGVQLCAASINFIVEDEVGIHTHMDTSQDWHEMFQTKRPTPVSLAAVQPQLELYAASAIVIDAETGYVIYEKDADTMRSPASMTKVMTAYLIFEELEAGRLTQDTKITISNRNAAISRNPNYPAMVNLRAGSQVSVDTLLKLILLPSSSASCIVMAEQISGSEEAFVQRMNETAQALGIDAQYNNCHGASPNSVSARAQATLTREFLTRFPAVLDYTSLHSVSFNGKTYHNSNKLLQSSYYYEGADGFKTGTTSSAGFCLTATAVSDERRLITVVMKSLSDHWRFVDTTTLLDAGFAWAEENEALLVQPAA